MNPHSISRRQFLATTAAVAGSAIALSAAETDAPSTTMGLAGDGWTLHRKAGQGADPLSFLRACREMKLGGIQCSLNFKSPDDIKTLRAQAEQWGMYVEASLPLITGSPDRFEHDCKIAKKAGISIARTLLFPGRRYEALHTYQQFIDAQKHAIETLKWAEPIAAKHGIILAVENHKDQRIDERIAMMKQFDSEHVGICIDFGNDFALCEDPLEVVKAFAPWARAAHIKDQSAYECPEGFLYADEALGDGDLDLIAMISALRAAQPKLHYSLEVITRNALLVPVLTADYWSTLPNVPAADLARTMIAVRKPKKSPRVEVSSMPRDQQLEMELKVVQRSIACAGGRLGLIG